MAKNKRRATLAHRCPRCRINTHWCFCEHIKTVESDVRVSIVMHHTERWLTSNTAHFASLVLPSCEIIERGVLDSPIPEDIFSCPDTDYLYLFPTEDSLPIREFAKTKKTVHLVVPDGSWSKAKKIHKRENIFKAMPKYHLIDVGTSNYQLRKSPGENFLCTYEVVANASEALDNSVVKDQMLEVFDVFVKRVLMSRKGVFDLDKQESL